MNGIFPAWGRILQGYTPALSIEITRECPLHCPGCYAYGDEHLGGATTLRELRDFKGQELVDGFLGLVDRHRPLHVSIVGGEPLVRFRELHDILPALAARNLHVQLVTSAVRPIPLEWHTIPRLSIVVSIDGLQPEHDARRKPATYDRVLANTKDVKINVHCTITSQIADRPGYLEEFLKFWSARPQTRKVWFSIFTPQRGATDQEILTPAQRATAIADLRRLQRAYPLLEMPDSLLRELGSPPASPEECIFARTTKTISADLKTSITPCQFGGDPDCRQCGCIASMALAAVGHHKVVGSLTAGDLFFASQRIGERWRRLTQPRLKPAGLAPAPSPFNVLKP